MKNHIWTALAVVAILLLLSACESDARFRVLNISSYPAYARVEDGAQVTIPAGGVHEFDIQTDTQSIFTGEVTKEIKVWMVGETYSIFEPDANQFIDSTWVTVKAGETLEAYLNPNRASIKVTNNSSQTINSATIWQHGGVNILQMGVLENIAPGESRFLRVAYGTSYYYHVTLLTADGQEYSYGDTSTVLAKDQQFHVIFNDPQ
jgi:hypothetical protein